MFENPVMPALKPSEFNYTVNRSVYMLVTDNK
jgi:hypothetical protein